MPNIGAETIVLKIQNKESFFLKNIFTNSVLNCSWDGCIPVHDGAEFKYGVVSYWRSYGGLFGASCTGHGVGFIDPF